MRKLLFLNRLALICNILFIVCLILKRIQDIKLNQDLIGLILILGWLCSFLLSVIVNIWAVILLLKKSEIDVPIWLVVTNLLFFIIEFIHQFILG
jgi:hypothetical protein